MGDGLLRIPALRAARTAFPDSRIIYGSGDISTLDTTLRGHAAHLVDDFRTSTPLLDILAECGGGPAAIVDFRIVVSRLIATRIRLFGSGTPYEANFPGFALSKQSGRGLAPRPEHNAWRNHRLIERLAGRRLPFDHRLDVSHAARQRAREIRGAKADRPLILICANAAPVKRMTDAQIVAVAGRLIDDGCQVIYLATPGDGPSPGSLEALEPRLQVFSPPGMDRRRLDDVFLALGEMATAYVGVEGGMAHLLATVMTPMVVINHGINMERWRPLSNDVEVVEARPYGRIADTPPDVILAAVDRLLSARRRDHPSSFP